MPKVKKVYDENGREIPTFKQLGITPDDEFREMQLGDEHYKRWFLSKVAAWQALNEPKRAQKCVIKSERERVAHLNFWYNSMPKDQVRRLILSAASKKDQVFEVFLLKIKMNSPLYKYYLELIDRVQEDRITLPTIPYSKLKRFPIYNKESDKLQGSSHAFVAMFTSCFPPKKKRRMDILL